MDASVYEAICLHIETTRDGVLKTCTYMHVSPKCFYEFRESSDEAGKRYARAKELQADAIVEEAIDIADHNTDDTLVDELGNARPDNEWIQRSKLRVDTRKWLAGKLRPKKYGDKLDLTSKGDKVQTTPLMVVCSNTETASILERMAHGEQPATSPSKDS